MYVSYLRSSGPYKWNLKKPLTFKSTLKLPGRSPCHAQDAKKTTSVRNPVAPSAQSLQHQQDPANWSRAAHTVQLAKKQSLLTYAQTYVYTYIYIHIYICTSERYIKIYIYIYTHIYKHTNTGVYYCISGPGWASVYIYIYVCVCINKRRHTHTRQPVSYAQRVNIAKAHPGTGKRRAHKVRMQRWFVWPPWHNHSC